MASPPSYQLLTPFSMWFDLTLSFNCAKPTEQFLPKLRLLTSYLKSYLAQFILPKGTPLMINIAYTNFQRISVSDLPCRLG